LWARGGKKARRRARRRKRDAPGKTCGTADAQPRPAASAMADPREFDGDNNAAACAWAADLVRLYARATRAANIAVVFDIDDTLLTPEPLRRRDAVANLYDACVGAGASVFIVTARPETCRAQTMTDLRAIGVHPRSGGAPGFAWLAMMPAGASDVPRYKLAERLAIARHLGADGVLLLAVGDQWWDVVGSDRRIEEMEARYADGAAAVVPALPPAEPARCALRVAS